MLWHIGISTYGPISPINVPNIDCYVEALSLEDALRKVQSPEVERYLPHLAEDHYYTEPEPMNNVLIIKDGCITDVVSVHVE
jgi:hypothetical protein